MPPTAAVSTEPVRLTFVRDTTHNYRRFVKGERPLQWFTPEEARRLIKSGAAQLDDGVPTYAETARREAEEGPSDPPPMRAGNPHGSLGLPVPPGDQPMPEAAPTTTTPTTAPPVERRK